MIVQFKSVPWKYIRYEFYSLGQLTQHDDIDILVD